MKPIQILLVEDNEGDVILTTEALHESNFPFTSLLLNKKGKCADEVTPPLITPDLNLPKLNGIEVLKNIKSNEETRHTPVIMLSTSAFEKDIQLCLQPEASCFMTKPMERAFFCQQAEGLKGLQCDYVLNHVN